MDAAPELGPHRPLAGRRAEDQLERLVDVVVPARERDAAGAVDLEGEGEARAEQVRHRRFRPYPRLMIPPEMLTIPEPWMLTWGALSVSEACPSTVTEGALMVTEAVDSIV